jgi:transposase
VRRKEARSGEADAQAALKKTRYLFLKNPENLSEQEAARMEALDLKHLATGQAYQMRLELQAIYRCPAVEKARERFGAWINWVTSRAETIGALMAPMKRVAKTVEKHLEGILAYWQSGLTTAFLEGLNSVFSAVKRKARGYRAPEYMITHYHPVTAVVIS